MASHALWMFPLAHEAALRQKYLGPRPFGVEALQGGAQAPHSRGGFAAAF